MVAVGGIASFVLSDDRVEVWGFFPAFSIWHWCSSTREGVYDVPKFGQCLGAGVVCNKRSTWLL